MDVSEETDRISAMDPQAHWDRVYTTKASEELSWFQPEPAISLQLLDRSGLTAVT